MAESNELKAEAAYYRALKRIDELMDTDPDTPEGDELELLVTLVELYEKKAYPINLPDPKGNLDVSRNGSIAVICRPDNVLIAMQTRKPR